MQTSHFSAMVKTHTGASSCPQTEQPVKKSNIMFETHVCVFRCNRCGFVPSGFLWAKYLSLRLRRRMARKEPPTPVSQW